MLLFAQLIKVTAIFLIIFYQTNSQLLTNCTGGENCDCDDEIYDFLEDFDFTTSTGFLLTTENFETTKNFVSTEENIKTTESLETTKEMSETTLTTTLLTTENIETTKNLITTEENIKTTESLKTTKEILRTTLNEGTTTKLTENLTTMSETLLETSTFSTTKTSVTTESTTQITTIPPFLSTNGTNFLTTENVQTTSNELTTNVVTDAQNTTLFATTQLPCGPCQVNQSLMLYDKNVLNSNQSINNVPASRCDTCNQSTISQICYNPRPISVVRIRCTDSKLFCVCASNQKACYTVTQNAPLYEADYLIYANESYSFLALNTGASEISNGKKTFEFSSSMTFIPNKSTFLNAPFLSVSCSGCDKIFDLTMKKPYTC